MLKLLNFWVLLTSVLRVSVKDSKIEIIGKCYVKNITFSRFKVLNASIRKQNFFFKLLNKCSYTYLEHYTKFVRKKVVQNLIIRFKFSLI